MTYSIIRICLYNQNNIAASGIPKHNLYIEMYGLSLGISYVTNLYPIFQNVYSPLCGNAIMDYAIYSMMDRADITHLFSDLLAQELLFIKKTYLNSWYSELFCSYLSDDHKHHFRAEWPL